MSSARLEALADRLELQQLVVDYAYAIDERAFDRLDAVFTADAWIDYSAMGGLAARYPEIREWLAKALKDFPAYMHLVGNCSFEIRGDEASGKVACFNPMVLPRGRDGGEETMFLGLWYHDRYVRTAEGWRICERVEQRCYDFNIPLALKEAMQKLK